MKLFLSLLLVSGAFVMAGAQDVKFTVSVSSDTILVGNYFELKYTIENAPAQKFEPPKINMHDIVSGPNTASSMSIVNGEMTQSASFTYYIQPDELGSYNIPPAFLELDGNMMEAPPIEIMVLPNPDGIIQQPHQAHKRFQAIDSLPDESVKPTRPRRKF